MRDRATIREGLPSRLERLEAIDPVAKPLQTFLARTLPPGRAAKDILSGTWLGHPLHPLLTDIVVGAWTGGFALDLTGSARSQRDAQRLVGLGVLAALPTALSGLSDWAELRGGTRRIGAVHAAGNGVALGLQASSWCARRAGRKTSAVGLSAVALAVVGGSAWLGGHLSFRRGVGVDQTVFEDQPTAWTAVIDDEKVLEGELIRRSARGTGVLLTRHNGAVHALIDRCSHRGCSLSEGELEGATITCPCHGSRFALDGSLLRGPATAPQPTLAVRVHAGKVEVRQRST